MFNFLNWRVIWFFGLKPCKQLIKEMNLLLISNLNIKIWKKNFLYNYTELGSMIIFFALCIKFLKLYLFLIILPFNIHTWVLSDLFTTITTLEYSEFMYLYQCDLYFQMFSCY